MNLAISRQIIKMPGRARFRKCPACNEPKQAREYRTSNRNPARHLICWQCRHTPRAEAKFYGDGIYRKPVFEDTTERDAAVLKVLKKMAQRRQIKKKEVINIQTIEKQAVALAKLPNRIAAIVGKTYAVMGDDFKMSDDEALTRIRDLLNELDATLIERNKKKRLSR